MSERVLADRTGVLLINLGSPDAPTKGAVRRFLREFLSDRRVVDLPRWLWWPLLHFIILTFRPAKSARIYQDIWTEEGSPLILTTKSLTDALRTSLLAENSSSLVVDCAMTYGSPSIVDALQRMQDSGVTRVIFVPLYPQYSDATTASVFDAVARALTTFRGIPEVRFIRDWFHHPLYLDALAETVEKYLASHDTPDRLIFSFHGIPKRYVDEGDPYEMQCDATVKGVIERISLPSDRCQMLFQSRFGREEWLQPYAENVIKALPSEGIKRVAVICPGFAVDCLETLQEMNMLYRDQFIEHGGTTYDYIPCLNASPSHVALLHDLVCANL